MAEKDLSQKALMEYPDVFADVFNAMAFDGAAVLDPKNLKQVFTEYVSRPGGRWKQLYRDVVMENVVTGVRYLILGIENQLAPDGSMPLRGMGMDYAAYEKQLKQLYDGKNKKHGARKRKKQKNYKKKMKPYFTQGKCLIPVVTLVLYYGQKNWSGPRSLHEMMVMPDEEQYPGLKKYIHDYGMNLVVLKDLSQAEEALFQSDFKYLVKYVRNRHDPAKQEELLRQEDSVLDHRKETMLAMAALSGDERYAGLAEEEEKEEMGVCKMLDYIEARGEARGMMLRLIEQIVKKYPRGLAVEAIAEQVEEEESVVEAICKVIRECGSDITSEEIYARLNERV